MAKQSEWMNLRDQEVQERFRPQFKPAELKPKTRGQKEYLESIRDHQLVFCSGPAGTGKSFLACGMAAKLFEKGIVKRIVLTRPLVECGRRVGALPGELEDKIGPYMEPLMQALGAFIDKKRLYEMRKDEQLVMSPLEYMRGTTFNDSFVIMDESQNVEEKQMLMFLTRIGTSRVVVNGDLDQIDLRYDEFSGLETAMRRLNDPEMGKVYLTDDDIVRSGLVKKIISQWYKRDDSGPIKGY